MNDQFITANGKKISASLPCSIEAFLVAQKLPSRSVVVEHNGDAVAPSEFARRMLAGGDRLEIVKIVARRMNPALTAFLAAFDTETVFAQVLIRRAANGFELRHVADRHVDAMDALTVGGLRALVQFTSAGAFRPLKSAPNLRRGWRALAPGRDALELALNHLYPGAVADWFAARSNPPPVTSYRQFTARQTGMYRITTTLDDRIAAAAIRACCHEGFCLKRRLWSVEGLAPDAPEQKSVIPCLEPCAILLEFARKVARLEREEKGPVMPPPVADGNVAESDFDAPNNPRRVRFALEKQRVALRTQLL